MSTLQSKLDELKAQQTSTEPEPKPAREPEPKPAPTGAGALESALRDLIAANVPTLDEARVVELIHAHQSAPVRHEVTLHAPGGEVRTIEGAHPALADVLRAAGAGVNVYLVGPAGCGKTTLARHAAEALGRAFHMCGAIHQEHKLLGFIDAGGTYHRTALRDAYEHGGVFLQDELDGSSASALLVVNAITDGSPCYAFPDGTVARHPEFIAIAAANTYGRGATRQYVGRQQLDDASLDRFAFLPMDYDEGVEERAALSAYSRAGGTDSAVAYRWIQRVRTIRAAVRRAAVRHLVTPRASIHGAALLAAGMATHAVEEACIWKGLPADQRATLGV